MMIHVELHHRLNLAEGGDVGAKHTGFVEPAQDALRVFFVHQDGKAFVLQTGQSSLQPVFIKSEIQSQLLPADGPQADQTASQQGSQCLLRINTM